MTRAPTPTRTSTLAMTRTLALALSVLLAGAAAAQPSRRELTQRLDRLLGGIERTASAADLAQLGPGADAALIAYAERPQTSPLRRLRAIAALRFVPTVAARDFLHHVLARSGSSQAGAPVLEAAAALGALEPYGPSELPIALPYLSHAAADVRQAAVLTVAAMRTPEAQLALEARLAVERDASVRSLLRAQLAPAR